MIGGIAIWDGKMGKVLSKHPTLGNNAIRQTKSNLLQLLLDAHKGKKNLKTGARTPSWMLDIFIN